MNTGFKLWLVRADSYIANSEKARLKTFWEKSACSYSLCCYLSFKKVTKTSCVAFSLESYQTGYNVQETWASFHVFANAGVQHSQKGKFSTPPTFPYSVMLFYLIPLPAMDIPVLLNTHELVQLAYLVLLSPQSMFVRQRPSHT